MKPTFTAKFSVQDVGKSLHRQKEKLDEAIFNRLSFIGEQFVADARDNVSIPFKIYQDQTGNLRASIGYIIQKDGKVLKQNFVKPRKVFNNPKTRNRGETKIGKDGFVIGKQLAESIAKKYPRGFVLIAVAGMEYAAAVESKGYNVISLQALQADAKIKQFVEQLKSKYA